ncbi:MAG: chorismate-binding protein [Muribaculaceae bacterium]|nr:chorismate-binding protein [Muribaculaceae bacterium]
MERSCNNITTFTTIPQEMGEAAALCLKRHIPFALYRLPGKECRFFSNPSGKEATMTCRQFGVAMWEGAFSNRSIIAEEMDARQTLCMGQEYHVSPTLINPWPHTTTKEEYQNGLWQIIARLKQRGGKTVISRVVSEMTSTTPEQWVETADRVFGNNTSALCCLYYTAETGAWICASPELLLDADFNHQTLHTIALAGTRRKPTEEGTEWSVKDIMEHEVVKHYITEKLAALGAEVEVSPTETCASGAIEHLRTPFSSKIPAEFHAAQFLDNVSPTPALCGYPENIAKEEIRATEGHPRYCYGGYITIETPERLLAYVNIRCVHFNEERMTLYAGSGIMPDSTPEGEWDETEAKLSAIGRNL